MSITYSVMYYILMNIICNINMIVILVITPENFISFSIFMNW